MHVLCFHTADNGVVRYAQRRGRSPPQLWLTVPTPRVRQHAMLTLP